MEQPQPAAEADEQTSEDESFAEATMIEPRSGPEAEERSYEAAVIEREGDAPESGDITSVTPPEEPVTSGAATETAGADWNAPPATEPAPDNFSPFAEGETESRRRSPLLTILILILIVTAAAVAFWFFAPANLKAKLGIAQAGATPLQSVITHMDRTPLESGNELLTVTGRVINPSSKEQEVPPIQAQLKNRSGKIVYSWTIQPPAQSLAPGASAPFNSAEVNVPPGGEEITLTLSETRAS